MVVIRRGTILAKRRREVGGMTRFIYDWVTVTVSQILL
jgi:hypothetical protein